MVSLDSSIFQNADKAREHLEKVRWPNGPICPHCGSVDSATGLKGKAHRPGVYQCNACREQFTVTVGTVFERSKVPLHKWLLATHLLTASKKGMSAHQLHRMLGVTYKTAWFMAHRIREAMRDDDPAPVGGSGQVVEADETYFGKRETPVVSKQRKGRPYKFAKKAVTKRSVVGLVERGGNARLFHVQHATADSVREILVTNIPRDTTLHTDESRLYTETGKEFASHQTVKHTAGEYVRGVVHTNTIENVFSVFKRGMRGPGRHAGQCPHGGRQVGLRPVRQCPHAFGLANRDVGLSAARRAPLQPFPTEDGDTSAARGYRWDQITS